MLFIFPFSPMDGARCWTSGGLQTTLQAAASNVYLYPETAMDISVQVDVAHDGVISTSTPPYNTGWNVHVDPDGTVDSVYDYLFYEASIPFMPSCPTGWLLNGANLEQECRDLLSNIGFVIHPLPVPLVITAPVLPTFQRNGYTVVEWGVYGWDVRATRTQMPRRSRSSPLFAWIQCSDGGSFFCPMFG